MSCYGSAALLFFFFRGEYVVNMSTTPGFHQVPTVFSLTPLSNLPTATVLPISHPFRNILFQHPLDLLSLSFPDSKSVETESPKKKDANTVILNVNGLSLF